METIRLGLPLLTTITFMPLLGAVILLFIKKGNRYLTRYIATFFMGLDFAFSVALFFNFDFAPEGAERFADSTWIMQVEPAKKWIESIGVQYYVGVDGLSILLVMLTTSLGLLATLSSWSAVKEREKEYYLSILLLQTGMIGVFVALDFFLFYVFWEVMLAPMYFLIGVWGGPRRLYAAIKFFLYTLLGSVFMLLGILALYFHHHDVTGVYSFDILRLFDPAVLSQLPEAWRPWVFIAFFLGFAIKVPLFPFHTWLPDAHVEAPTAGSVMLAGVLLKMGAYGLLRFSLPLLPADPDARSAYVLVLAALAIIGIIYGALAAMAQKDIKRLVAYSSVSHLGFVVLGLFALNEYGIEGGILQMVNHGLSTGALFLLVGVIYERRHTREISEFGGLASQMPVYSAFFLIVALSSIGLPALNGFVGEFLILVGAFKVNYLFAVFAVGGVLLGAVYMLWAYQRMMFGKLDKTENKNLLDLNRREVIYLTPIIVLIFWIGIYPPFFLKYMDASVEHLIQRHLSVQPKEQASHDVKVSRAALNDRERPGRGAMASSQSSTGDGRYLSTINRQAARTASPQLAERERAEQARAAGDILVSGDLFSAPAQREHEATPSRTAGGLIVSQSHINQ